MSSDLPVVYLALFPFVFPLISVSNRGHSHCSESLLGSWEVIKRNSLSGVIAYASNLGYGPPRHRLD